MRLTIDFQYLPLPAAFDADLMPFHCPWKNPKI